MKRNALALALVLGATTLFGQATPAPAPETRDRQHDAKARARADVGDPDVSYGRVKEITAGQKIVIDIDNAPDKTFDLADDDLKVNLAKGLKVGDTVKVAERSEMGKTKAVVITKHSGGGVTHGDKDAQRSRTQKP